MRYGGETVQQHGALFGEALASNFERGIVKTLGLRSRSVADRNEIPREVGPTAVSCTGSRYIRETVREYLLLSIACALHNQGLSGRVLNANPRFASLVEVGFDALP